MNVQHGPGGNCSECLREWKWCATSLPAPRPSPDEAAARAAYEAEMLAEGYAKMRGLSVAMLWALGTLAIGALFVWWEPILAWLGWP